MEVVEMASTTWDGRKMVEEDNGWMCSGRCCGRWMCSQRKVHAMTVMGAVRYGYGSEGDEGDAWAGGGAFWICTRMKGERWSALLGLWGHQRWWLGHNEMESFIMVKVVYSPWMMETAGVERSDLRVALRASRKRCTG
ncbi:hypothetical protein MRB53_030804 [Persea americana]|uniref:Uncharacterized protein n=1 Tax=Persea americana TaxID=3435 RepID=A0ACC2KMA5_PERAE|nr:hypothetical protein MRB53_030804 [Persea americana]